MDGYAPLLWFDANAATRRRQGQALSIIGTAFRSRQGGATRLVAACADGYTRPVERFGLGHLLEDQPQPPSATFYWLLGAIFLAALLVALYAYLRAVQRATESGTPPPTTGRLAAWAAAFSGLGLAATIWTFLTVPGLSKRLWLVIALAGLLATALAGLRSRLRQRARPGGEEHAGPGTAPPTLHQDITRT